ncbi:MAG: hypothetical protein HQ504_06965 [Rhodospirillaceae bacterium]|nr:hypothetical protein [Rhodospirillaceae bacterium]
MSYSVRAPGVNLPAISENGVLDSLLGLLKEPLIIPIYSALVAVVIAFIAQWIWDSHKAKKARYHALLIVREALLDQRQRFADMRRHMEQEKSYIHSSVDAHVIKSFLIGTHVDVVIDKQLINALNAYLGSLNGLSTALSRIDFASGGYTNVQHEYKARLEQGILEAIPSYIAEIENCIFEIDKVPQGSIEITS